MVTQLVGGLRSGMGYTGCRTIKEFQGKDSLHSHHFGRLARSHVHDVINHEEAPTIVWNNCRHNPH